jgi:hypothetical protein
LEREHLTTFPFFDLSTWEMCSLFILEEWDDLVCKLVKALYGLKQAPQAWYEKINKYLKSRSFKRSDSDPNLYIKEKGEEIIIMVVYVDDLIITGSSDDLIQEEKDSLCKSFDMTDLGLLHYCLGIEVWQQPNRFSSHRQSMLQNCWKSSEWKIVIPTKHQWR